MKVLTTDPLLVDWKVKKDFFIGEVGKVWREVGWGKREKKTAQALWKANKNKINEKCLIISQETYPQ